MEFFPKKNGVSPNQKFPGEKNSTVEFQTVPSESFSETQHTRREEQSGWIRALMLGGSKLFHGLRKSHDFGGVKQPKGLRGDNSKIIFSWDYVRDHTVFLNLTNLFLKHQFPTDELVIHVIIFYGVNMEERAHPSCVKSKRQWYYNLVMRSVPQVSGGFQGYATTYGWTWPTKCGWLVGTLQSAQTWVPMYVVRYSRLAWSRKGSSKHHGWVLYVLWDQNLETYTLLSVGPGDKTLRVLGISERK